MRKKIVAGAAVLALLMNSPQVSADDEIVIFGGEFEEESASPPKKVEKPAPVKELPPVKKSEPKPEPAKPEKIEPQTPPQEPINLPVEDEEGEWGDKLVFNDLSKTPPIEEPQPVEEPQPSKEEILLEPLPTTEKPFSDVKPAVKPIDIPPPETQIETRPQRSFQPRQSAQPQQNLKTLKPRFVKLAVDDTYTYYLDKTSVKWVKMPYSSSEYMADVWIRMVENKPQALDDDMANYGAENFNAEISFAREQGYQYAPEDLKVLRSQAYVLEHYYLRPKTNQIQFLCELEVFGRPQNTINERAYDYRNWENLVPGSVESVIYSTVIKTIGKSKAGERGHMTFFDMLDEYARIALN